MINFAEVVKLAIPEGYAKKITSSSTLLWEGIKKIETVPAQSGTLTYTGSALTPTWNNYNSEQLTIGGTTSATDAGTYTATFTPNSGYSWANGSVDAISVNWTIGRASITAIPSQSGTLTYSGSAQTPTWNNYSTTQLIIGGTTSSTNAGSYNAIFTPTSNYKWSDGSTTTKEVSWSIAKAASSLKLYTNSSHTVEKTNKSINKTNTRSSTLYIQAIGDGLMQAESNNTNLVTIDGITNTTLSYRVILLPARETTVRITISIAEGINYMASSCYIDIICEKD